MSLFGDANGPASIAPLWISAAAMMAFAWICPSVMEILLGSDGTRSQCRADRFSRGKRGPVLKAPAGKTRITIRIDDDLLRWFRKQVHAAGGGSYQTLMVRIPLTRQAILHDADCVTAASRRSRRRSRVARGISRGDPVRSRSACRA